METDFASIELQLLIETDADLLQLNSKENENEPNPLEFCDADKYDDCNNETISNLPADTDDIERLSMISASYQMPQVNTTETDDTANNGKEYAEDSDDNETQSCIVLSKTAENCLNVNKASARMIDYDGDETEQQSHDQLTLSDDLIVPDADDDATDNQSEINSNQCRICLATENLINIFEFGPSQNGRICDFIMKLCASIRISSNDGLPQFVCDVCMDRINLAHELIAQSEKTEKLLRSKLTRHKRQHCSSSSLIMSDESADDKTANKNLLNENGSDDDEEFNLTEKSIDSSDTKSEKISSELRQRPTSKCSQLKLMSANLATMSGATVEGETIENDEKRLYVNRSKPKRKSISLVCSQCQHVFKQHGSYQRHLEKHLAERENRKCIRCEKLETKEYHANTFDCTKCWRSFASITWLRRHQAAGICKATTSTRMTKMSSTLTKRRRFNDDSFNNSGRDLFKSVAPSTTTYWSDSSSD